MTISVLEVAAIFKIDGQPAIRALQRIAEEARALSKELKDIALGIDKNFGTAFSGMSSGIAAQKTEVAQLATEWRNVERAALAAGRVTRTGMAHPRPGSVPGIGPTHPRTHSPGNNVGQIADTVLAGHPPRAGHGVALGAAAAAGYSIWEAYKVDDTVTNTIASAFPKGMPSDFGVKRNQLIDLIKHESEVTGIPLQEMAHMVADEVRVNASLPWAQQLENIPMVIEGAAAEAAKKGIDPIEGVKAFVGGLHQNQAFTPEDIRKKGGLLAYFASMDPNSVTNFTKSSAYHTPVLGNLMNVPMEQDLSAQVVLDRAGVGGKSGTWLREMILNSAIPSFKDRHYKSKMANLREWGLADEQGHSTVMTDGHYDEQKIIHRLAEHLKSLPVEKRAAELKMLLGTRGGEAAAILTQSDNMAQFDTVLAGASAVQDPADWWKEQATLNPALRLRQDWVKTQEAALSAGQILLPPFTGAANVASSVLGWGAGLLPEPNSAGAKRGEALGGGALVGGVIGGALGIPGGPAGILGGAVLGGAIGAEAGFIGSAIGGAFLDTVKRYFVTPAHAEGSPPPPPGFSDRFGTWPSSFDDRFGTWPGKQSFNAIPPPKTVIKEEHVTTLNIDGEQLARIVESRIAQTQEFHASGDYSNGVAYPNINGGNPVDK